MSAAAPTADASGAAPAKKGKKKLIVIALIVVVLLAVAGGAAFFLLKKKAPADGEEAEAPAAHAPAHSTVDPKHPPTFLPLDAFVVNLADKDADRYAQIGITLEVDDAKFADQMKTYMPAIRNGVLMILAHKTSQELLQRSGKEMLAGQIQREAARTMGIDIEEPDPEDANDGQDDEPKPKAKGKAKAKKKKVVDANPVRKVHFSNFIIQ